MNGEDEEEVLCGNSDTSATSGKFLNQQSAGRIGRDMDLTNFRVRRINGEGLCAAMFLS